MSKSTKHPIVRLGDIAEILAGCHLKKEPQLNDTHYTYRLYRGALSADTSEEYCCNAETDKRYLSRVDDIVISTKHIKDVALIEKDSEGLLISDHYLILRCDPEKAFSEYIRDELLTEHCCKERKRLCRDAVFSHQKAQKYRDMKLRIPSPQKQAEVCEWQKELEKALIDFIKSREDKRY